MHDHVLDRLACGREADPEHVRTAVAAARAPRRLVQDDPRRCAAWRDGNGGPRAAVERPWRGVGKRGCEKTTSLRPGPRHEGRGVEGHQVLQRGTMSFDAGARRGFTRVDPRLGLRDVARPAAAGREHTARGELERSIDDPRGGALRVFQAGTSDGCRRVGRPVWTTEAARGERHRLPAARFGHALRERRRCEQRRPPGGLHGRDIGTAARDTLGDPDELARHGGVVDAGDALPRLAAPQCGAHTLDAGAYAPLRRPLAPARRGRPDRTARTRQQQDDQGERCRHRAGVSRSAGKRVNAKKTKPPPPPRSGTVRTPRRGIGPRVRPRHTPAGARDRGTSRR